MEYVSYDKAMADAERAAAGRKRQEAAERAAARDDWYVRSGLSTTGPYSEKRARLRVDKLLSNGRKPKLLRVVEDYE